MNTERLLRLADLVETIAPEKFDLASWREEASDDSLAYRVVYCGTIGCAIGHACFNHWFVRQGLGLTNPTMFFGPRPTYLDLTGFDAVSEFFDLPHEFGGNTQAKFLFSEGSYVTRPAHPSEVAIRIRLFVEHHDEKVVRELESV